MNIKLRIRTHLLVLVTVLLLYVAAGRPCAAARSVVHAHHRRHHRRSRPIWSPYMPDAFLGGIGKIEELEGIDRSSSSSKSAAGGGDTQQQEQQPQAAAAAAEGPASGAAAKPGNAYRQVLARAAGGRVKRSADLGMALPQPWDLVNLTAVLEDNLAPTLRLWRAAAPRRPRVRDIFRLALNSSYHGQSDTRRVAVIRNGTVTFPLMPPGPARTGCTQATCNPQLIAWLEGMRRAVDVYGLKLPDVVISLNVQDGGGPCAQGQIEDRVPACAAPSLVVSKLDVGSDLAAPMLLLPDANVTLRHAPWAAKRARAFFRGVPSCGDMQMVQPGACARTWFARLAQRHPEALDAGLVEPHRQTAEEVAADPALRDNGGPLPVLPRAPRDKLPLHKYLINLDGHTAAYRLATLLGTNSLVLKQASRQVEWYYGSLRPGGPAACSGRGSGVEQAEAESGGAGSDVGNSSSSSSSKCEGGGGGGGQGHYVPILASNKTDVLDALAWAEAHPREVGAIVANANRFALTYTTYYARVLYWVYVLRAYRDLVEGQDEYFATRGASVADLVAEHARQRGYDQQQQQQQEEGDNGGDGGGAGEQDASIAKPGEEWRQWQRRRK